MNVKSIDQILVTFCEFRDWFYLYSILIISLKKMRYYSILPEINKTKWNYSTYSSNCLFIIINTSNKGPFINHVAGGCAEKVTKREGELL